MKLAEIYTNDAGAEFLVLKNNEGTLTCLPIMVAEHERGDFVRKHCVLLTEPMFTLDKDAYLSDCWVVVSRPVTIEADAYEEIRVLGRLNDPKNFLCKMEKKISTLTEEDLQSEHLAFIAESFP